MQGTGQKARAGLVLSSAKRRVSVSQVFLFSSVSGGLCSSACKAQHPIGAESMGCTHSEGSGTKLVGVGPKSSVLKWKIFNKDNKLLGSVKFKLINENIIS